MQKRGQTTLFVIIGILLVAAVALILWLRPGPLSQTSSSDNPNAFLQTCLEADLQETVELLSLQGGSIDPVEPYPYNTITQDIAGVAYLCYTNEYYRSCVVQEPLLDQHIEEEIKKDLAQSVNRCFAQLRENYERQGYTVGLQPGETTVELLPKRIVMTFERPMSLRKGDESLSFDTFRVVLNNNLYELVSIAKSIVNWETRYGDADVTLYMDVYHDLKAEKKKQSDGTTVYILTDKNTGNMFQFASRSMALPPGVSANI